MMRYELAGSLCRRMQVTRLERAGERVPELEGNALDGLPDAEKQNWLDMADILLRVTEQYEPVRRLQTLAEDWARYTMIGPDPHYHDDLRRAVVIEMRGELDRLARECDL